MGGGSVIYHSLSHPLFYLHLDCQLFLQRGWQSGGEGERLVCARLSSSGWFLAQGNILLDLLLFDAD